MIAPVLLGAASAWRMSAKLDPWFFVVVLAGALLLHLAANGIDDVYDHVSGVDPIADSMFPRDAPGWKPIQRGLITVRRAYLVSVSLYALSLLIGFYLSLVVGWFALLIAIPGALLSYFYTAPPARLDYRGLGLGELSVFLSFGPIPALGAFYVLSGKVSWEVAAISLPAGALTVCVLLCHDLIYYDAYKEGGKRSLAVVLGRSATAKALSWTVVVCYFAVTVAVASAMLPPTCLAVVAALPLFSRFWDFGGEPVAPPVYGARTTAAFIHSAVFTSLLALGLALA
jgi:1,4-dihydroxy-2-naphthoate polyprenyltransferase